MAKTNSSDRPKKNQTVFQVKTDFGERVRVGGVPPALPCPFCGASSIDVSILKEGGDSLLPYYSWADCCGSRGPQAESIKAAAQSWNERKGMVTGRARS